VLLLVCEVNQEPLSPQQQQQQAEEEEESKELQWQQDAAEGLFAWRISSGRIPDSRVNRRSSRCSSK
jgi:hypothetical protein